MRRKLKSVLFVQFANSMFLRHSDNDRYWEAFYKLHEDIGYYKGKYVFEPPKWIAEICYFLYPVSVEREVLWVEHNVNEVVKKIEASDFDYVFFSLMNCNQSFIEVIVMMCPNQKFIIGGYNDKFLEYLDKTYSNATIVKAMKDCADVLNVKYSYGTDYSLFMGDSVVPRLTLSSGCLNRCKFCIVPHGRIIDYPYTKSLQQVRSFNALDYRLIYIDDKTFGQANNYAVIEDLGKIIRTDHNHKDFNGFIVQTTCPMIVNKAQAFKDLGVYVAEIGVETYNDDILRAYNKPSTCRLAERAIEEGNKCGLKMIANLIIGLPEETEETYQRTYDFIMPLLEEDKLIGINFAIYTDYENEDNNGEIDFLEDEKVELHRKWWRKFNFDAANILETKIINKN